MAKKNNKIVDGINSQTVQNKDFKKSTDIKDTVQEDKTELNDWI